MNKWSTRYVANCAAEVFSYVHVAALLHLNRWAVC